MDKLRCGTCGYWTGTPGSHIGAGRCRRYPPSPAVVGSAVIGGQEVFYRFPKTEADTWCGEYEAREDDDGRQDP